MLTVQDLKKITYRILVVSTKMGKFCTNMDSLILHGTIALEDYLPRPSTSNIDYECNGKIPEFMYPDGDRNLVGKWFIDIADIYCF